MPNSAATPARSCDVCQDIERRWISKMYVPYYRLLRRVRRTFACQRVGKRIREPSETPEKTELVSLFDGELTIRGSVRQRPRLRWRRIQRRRSGKVGWGDCIIKLVSGHLAIRGVTY